MLKGPDVVTKWQNSIACRITGTMGMLAFETFLVGTVLLTFCEKLQRRLAGCTHVWTSGCLIVCWSPGLLLSNMMSQHTSNICLPTMVMVSSIYGCVLVTH